MALLTEPNLSGRGKREDLMDMIALVDAKDTPFTSMARKGSKPGNMYFRWQADQNPGATIGGVVDGTDVTSGSYNNFVTGYRKELANYAQIFRQTVRVSKLTQDIADVAGIRDELSDNIAKAIIAIKRSMEATFTSDQLGQADNGTVPYLTAGIQAWIGGDNIGTGLNIGSGTTSPSFVTPAASIVTAANASALTDATVQGVLKSIYDQTGKYKSFDAIVGTDLKRAFTALLGTTALTTTAYNGVPTGGGSAVNLVAGATKVQTFQRDAAADTFIQSVDVFQGDFGTVRLHPTTFMGTVTSSGSNTTTYTPRSAYGLVLDMDLVEVRYGGNVAQVTALPDNGGGPARLIEAVAGLVVGNPLGFGKFVYAAA
jgi:hypothetical protein